MREPGGESEGPVWLKRGVEVRGQGLNSLRQGRGADHGEPSWLWDDLRFHSE